MQQNVRRKWFAIHHWIGLKLSIFISFVMITGTLASVSNEIDWLLDSDRRILPPYQTEHYDWQGLVDAATAARPDWAFQSITAPIDPWFAVEALAITPEGKRRRLLLDPRSVSVLDDAGWINAQQFLRDAHRRLLVMNRAGIIMVSSLSILILLSLISGLIVYKKFWRSFFKKPRLNSKRIFWGDLHRLGGIWSIWFIVLISLTSLWYLIESVGILVDWRVTPYPEHIVEETQTASSRSLPVSLNTLVEITVEQEQNFRATSILLPQLSDESIFIRGENNAILTRDRVNQFEFDPVSGQLLSQIEGTDLRIIQRISEMSDPLHFGTFGGLSTKIIYFIFGCILSGLSLSGIYIYSMRIRKVNSKIVVDALISSSQSNQLKRKPGNRLTAWHEMGAWKWINTALVIFAFAAIYPYWSIAPGIHRISGDIIEGSFSGCSYKFGFERENRKITVLGSVAARCTQLLETPMLSFQTSSNNVLKTLYFSGNANALVANFEMPTYLVKETHQLVITLSLYGETEELHWLLDSGQRTQ